MHTERIPSTSDGRSNASSNNWCSSSASTPRVLAKFGHSGDLLTEQLPLGLHLAGGNAVGHEGAVAVAAFEQSLGRQPLVDAEDRVLVDGQFGGQARTEGSRSPGFSAPLAHWARIWAAICRVMGIPEDVSTRMRTGRASSDYTSITVITWVSRGSRLWSWELGLWTLVLATGPEIPQSPVRYPRPKTKSPRPKTENREELRRPSGCAWRNVRLGRRQLLQRVRSCFMLTGIPSTSRCGAMRASSCHRPLPFAQQQYGRGQLGFRLVAQLIETLHGRLVR